MKITVTERPQDKYSSKSNITDYSMEFFQVSLKYNVPEPEDVPAFESRVYVRTRRSLPEEANSACYPLKLETKVM